ncbi:hypothetical protein SBADM41S_04967 [Streptomyces badius]
MNLSHLASSVAVNPLTEVSGERSSWATVAISSAWLRSGTPAGLGPPQADHDPAHRSGRVLAYVTGGDEHLAAAGQQQIALGLAVAGGETAVRVGQRPPALPLEVLQRKDGVQRQADRVGAGGRRDPGGGGVEADDVSALVGDDETVGEIVRVETTSRAVRRRAGPAGSSAAARTGGGARRSRRTHADSHLPVSPPFEQVQWAPEFVTLLVVGEPATPCGGAERSAPVGGGAGMAGIVC